MKVQLLMTCSMLIAGASPTAKPDASPPTSRSRTGALGATEHPPATPVREVKDTYFGTSVADPYRWLENTESPEYVKWLKAQSQYSRSILDGLPNRRELLDRVHSLNNAGVTITALQLAGNRLIYMKSEPGSDNRRLYVRTSLKGKERLLVDPEKLTDKGTHYSIDYFRASHDGRYVAYGLSRGGSEDSMLHVIETDTGRVLKEEISRTQFAHVSWHPSNSSFFYARRRKLEANEPKVNIYKKGQVFWHTLGGDPEKDSPIFGYATSTLAKVDEDDFPAVEFIPGSPYVFGIVTHGVKNERTIYAAPLSSLESRNLPWRLLVDVADEVVNYEARGGNLYLLTHKDSPHFKVLRMSIEHPNLATAEVVVQESKVVIRSIALSQDALYVRDLDGGIGRLRKLSLNPSRTEAISLPFEGAVGALSTDPTTSGVVFSTSSWTRSPVWYAYDWEASGLVDTHLVPPSLVDYSSITSEEVIAPSTEGVQVPLSIVYKKGLARDGSHPTLLRGYGAYGFVFERTFSRTLLAWLERGGVFAVAHIRGGGEYGEEWHQAGMKLTKQHTIDDFIACAKYLIEQGYTAANHIGGEGTSAGGITIGGAITQRPDLFGAAVDRVGVSDMVRFETTQGGPANIHEFGTIRSADGFKGLFAMSAYYHVKDHTPYPAVLLTTGVNDPRVPSWQPAKMAARLQAATSSRKPVLLRVDYDAGHGLGSTKSQAEADWADEVAFLFWQLTTPIADASRAKSVH